MIGQSLAHYQIETLLGAGGLAERIAKGSGLRAEGSIGEALAIARQIAEALEAAHEKGVIHSDLKPANVKVTPEDDNGCPSDRD